MLKYQAITFGIINNLQLIKGNQKGINKMQKEIKKRRGYATQAQQREADKRYYHASEENRQRKQYLNTRSTARNFIEKRAKFEDLKDLQERIEKKIKSFKENT
jgi:hypothetical protein